MAERKVREAITEFIRAGLEMGLPMGDQDKRPGGC